MHPWQSRRLTAVPQHWPVRLEIVKAIHTLAAEIEEEKELRKRAEAAEAQRRQDDLQRAVDKAIEAFRGIEQALRKYGFNPNEPRVPAGHRQGGQWTKEDWTTAPNASAPVVSAAPPDAARRSGARYAANEPTARGTDHDQHPLFDASPPEIPQARVDSRNSPNQEDDFAVGFGEGAIQSFYDDARFSYRWFTPFGPLYGLVDGYLPDDLFGPAGGEAEASGRTAGTIAETAATFLVGGAEALIPRAAETAGPRLIGSFAVPRQSTFGTTTFGDYAHNAVASRLPDLYPGAKFIFRVLPGQKGVDVTVVGQKWIDAVGFPFAEIKPLTASGEASFSRQVSRWNLPGPVQPITYDAAGNVYLGLLNGWRKHCEQKGNIETLFRFLSVSQFTTERTK